jgi:site-specific recombinase XerD
MTRQLTETIKKVETVARDARLTAPQFRYVCKRVRENIGLSIPKVSQTLPNYLTPAEIYNLLDKSKESANDALLMEFLIFTGLRVAEAANLLVTDLYFTEHVLKVTRGKGSKDRFVPITNNLQSKLLLYLNGRKTGFLFCKSNGAKFTTRALQYKVTYWLKQCGFTKELSTQSLRHTFGCLAMAKLKDIKQVSVLMGHSSYKTTEIYAKIMLPNLIDDFLRLMDTRG